MLERGIPHTVETDWPTSADSLDAVLPLALSTARSARAESALLDVAPLFGEHALAMISLRGGEASVRLAASELAVLPEIERWLRETFPPAEASAQLVPMCFWSHASYGASSTWRSIAVPTWEEIRANYPLDVREQLEPVLSPTFRPSEGGRLILWYGRPGTGKTSALRALGWEWRAWCDVHYVVDPEVLFGNHADYLLEVVLDEDDDEAEEERWRLLVLEDTGELLAADAKERTGQGLSRLLNLADGIVGQALRLLVLVTTNEPLRRLHPAVARPGRCAAKVEFLPFPAAEAQAWLAAHHAAGAGVVESTLASLFARLRGEEPEPERPFGFRV